MPASSGPSQGRSLRLGFTDGEEGRAMHQQRGKYTGLALPCGSGMAKNNLRGRPVAGWCPPACAIRCLMPLPAPELGEASGAQGHSSPLPSEPAGSQKTRSPGEAHSGSVTPGPSPQALLVTTSFAVLKQAGSHPLFHQSKPGTQWCLHFR